MKIVTLNEIHRYIQNFMLYKMIYFSSHKFAFSNLRFSPFYEHFRQLLEKYVFKLKIKYIMLINSLSPILMMYIHMTFSKKKPLHTLHPVHSTELFKIFFSLLTLSTTFLQKACGPGKNYLDTDRFDLEGYTSFKVHSSIRFGGCVVYVRNTLQCNVITELSGTNHVSDHLYVNVNVPGSRKKLCVTVYYRHNKHDKETVCNFTKQIDTQLNSPLLKNTHVILMGDMNIDLSKLSVNDAIEIYYNTLLCHNLESHINSPTRIQ